MAKGRDIIHVDCFSVGIDDLSKKDQANHLAVLKVLAFFGKFSCFEASANPTIARTMTKLCAGNLMTTDKEKSSYPWTYVTLTKKGHEALAKEKSDELSRGSP